MAEMPVIVRMIIEGLVVASLMLLVAMLAFIVLAEVLTHGQRRE